MENADVLSLLKDIQANQQSLHDDMASVVDRLSKLENEITELTKHSNQPTAIDEHELYIAARALVVETGKASTSMLQRIFRIGYSRAAALIDKLEENEIIGPHNGSTPRAVHLDADALYELEHEEENGPMPTGDTDELYNDAVTAVREAGKCSTSYLQRKLRIGYSRAAFIQDLLEKNGIIGPQDGVKPHEVFK